ncbi:hypothetical protein, partial [Xanthocytophaga agilis]
MKKRLLRTLNYIILLFGFCSIVNAQSLYWVGDGGSWNDASHWSATSGGSGGAGVPTTSNAAIFD